MGRYSYGQIMSLVLPVHKTSCSFRYISPIYKGKGEVNDPDNYRGITVLSCFGKLFTSVINDRIHSFLETSDILGNEQSGFRKGHSTMDHVFALHCLTDEYLQRKKRSYFVRLLTIKRPLTVCSADCCGENC